MIQKINKFELIFIPPKISIIYTFLDLLFDIRWYLLEVEILLKRNPCTKIVESTTSKFSFSQKEKR